MISQLYCGVPVVLRWRHGTRTRARLRDTCARGESFYIARDSTRERDKFFLKPNDP